MIIMKIAILGGTGDIGEGLALRLALKHDVIVGSREEAKAQEAAEKYNNVLKENGFRGGIKGMTNLEATKNAQIIILAVKYQVMIPTIESVFDELDNKIVITPIVPMSKSRLCAYTPPEPGSASRQLCAVLPPGIRIVSTFHTLPAPRLADLKDPLGFDLIVCADDEEAKMVAMKLAEDLGGVRALDGGSLEEAKLVESLTPLLINLAIKNKTKPLSIKFV
ncbi:putative coenzyme F420-dependent NADP reductase [Methanocella arvoryzae MRE50]|uniref:Coenzyme F420-dependent NADP reductase n=2 Tax=Methanocella TaxID=570266 RepID=Q0W532_METAR|nr:putative coenzyme F420-dependent NADP reductase [Methanocella arvoryzae MRE50]